MSARDSMGRFHRTSYNIWSQGLLSDYFASKHQLVSRLPLATACSAGGACKDFRSEEPPDIVEYSVQGPSKNAK